MSSSSTKSTKTKQYEIFFWNGGIYQHHGSLPYKDNPLLYRFSDQSFYEAANTAFEAEKVTLKQDKALEELNITWWLQLGLAKLYLVFRLKMSYYFRYLEVLGRLRIKNARNKRKTTPTQQRLIQDIVYRPAGIRQTLQTKRLDDARTY